MGTFLNRRVPWLPCVATAAAMAAFVWLMSNVPLVAVPGASNDDGLFVRMAGYLLAGDWLGPYGPNTLSKGPFYSLWIAASWVGGLPLVVSQSVLYAVCCLTLIRALRPWLRSECVAFAVLLLLLFNPVTYSEAELRAVREGLYTPLTVLLLAMLVFWVRARADAPRRRAMWAIGIGLLLGVYWCTREEGLWMVPAVALGLAIPCVGSIAAARKPLLREVALVATLVVAAAGVVGGFAAMNWLHYGVANVVELKQREFLDAYGAFVRIRTDEVPIPYVIASRAQRARAYEVSPAAVELMPHLDGPVMDGLIGAGCRTHAIAACDGELRAGWFVWALRGAAAEAGHYATAQAARGYFARVAAEIDAACGDGRLSCLPARRTLSPPFRADFISATARRAGAVLRFMAAQGGLAVPRGAQSCIKDNCGSSFPWAAFLDLVHASALFVPGQEVPPGFTGGVENTATSVDIVDYRAIPVEQRVLPFQLRAELIARIMDAIMSAYRVVMPIFLGIAVLAYAASAVLGVWRRTLAPLLVVASAAALVVLTRVVLLAYLDATSFPALNTLYLSPAYPALLVFGATAILGFVHALGDRRLARR